MPGLSISNESIQSMARDTQYSAIENAVSPTQLDTGRLHKPENSSAQNTHASRPDSGTHAVSSDINPVQQNDDAMLSRAASAIEQGLGTIADRVV
ncbi:hypothetical protein [Pseudodesulfovibrio senegalensis]|jgi:hypothetical protein|uniref:Uncharacterized protein n=1 Tax=Pseudodesulfovibrio senegalensis TaxID=1721087 RepID=A0A6N6N0I3_9BACT|nr:hypothetical protein [Pseudodesulfovibrio senegalensis]KAB1441085.1 hypothetical protein F8A88_11660 [Pseudodesulfovibrio senegalensis]